MKFDKSRILGFILIVYVVMMGVIIFPYYKSQGEWVTYVLVLLGALSVAIILLYFFKKQKKNKKDD